MKRKISILFVCLGNICRSPMAEFVMKDLVRRAGAEERFFIASAATSTWEIGNPIHEGSQRVMREMGIPFEDHRATLLRREDYEAYDLILGMDRENLRDMLRIFGGDPEGKVQLLLSVDGEAREIADPWYTGDFKTTWRDITLACRSRLADFGEKV